MPFQDLKIQIKVSHIKLAVAKGSKKKEAQRGRERRVSVKEDRQSRRRPIE